MFGWFRKKKRMAISSEELKLATPWLLECGFDPEDVSFSAYRDNNLMKEGSALLLVGYGRADGSPTGFAIEMSATDVVEARELHPGAASYHVREAQKALYEGSLLIHKLVELSLRMNTQ